MKIEKILKLTFFCFYLMTSFSFAQEAKEIQANSLPTASNLAFKNKKNGTLENTLDTFKVSLDRFQKVFEGKNITEMIKTLKEQINWEDLQDKMFAGKNQKLRGEKPLKANGMEEILNVSLSSLRLMNPRELEQVVLEHTAGGPLHSLLSKDYKSLSYVVKLMQDPKALPFFGRMVDQRNKFYIFLGFVLFSFIEYSVE